jgi:hypothetical protein
MEDYKNREAVRRSHGNFQIVDPFANTPLEGDTLQCCHCGMHWIPIKGSGIQRGFCRQCMQVTCGSPQCHVCVPQEKQLRIIERKANAASLGY